MKGDAPKRRTQGGLVQQVVEICLEQDEALKDLGTRRYNKLYDRLEALVAELKAQDGDQRLLLLALYDHPNAQVRLKAAIHTVAHNPEQAIQILQQIVDPKEEPQVPYAWGLIDAIKEGRYLPD